MVKVHEVEVKSIINPSQLPDADFVANPYIGCQHACGYCFADFMFRVSGQVRELGYTPQDWGNVVLVRTNAAQTITNKPSYQGKTLLIGSTTDPYQQQEGKYGITRDILQRLIELQIPFERVEILTK